MYDNCHLYSTLNWVLKDRHSQGKKNCNKTNKITLKIDTKLEEVINTYNGMTERSKYTQYMSLNISDDSSNPYYLHELKLYQLSCSTEMSSFDTSGVTAIIRKHSTRSCQPQQSQYEKGRELFKELR